MSEWSKCLRVRRARKIELRSLTILDAFFQQQTSVLSRGLPARRATSLGRDAIVELCENFEAVIKHVLLLLNCQPALHLVGVPVEATVPKSVEK